MNDNSPKPPKRGVGRPSKLPPLSQIEGVAARVRTNDQIARACGISPTTLYKNKRLFAQFTQAIENGRAKLQLQVSDTLVAGALQGEFAKQAFYLERFCGWTKPCDSEPPSASVHRGLSSDLVAVLRESLLGELQRPRSAELIEPPPAPIPTTAITVADQRAELLGRNGHGDGSDE